MRISLIGLEANVQNRVGSNQYAFELMKALHQLDQKNEYFIYLAKPPLDDLPKERKNWQYRVVRPARFWNIFGLPRALYQQKPKPDIVFNPGHYCPLFSPAPLVVSIMDLGYLRYPKQFTLPILAKLKFWTAFAIKRASHILAISQSTKNDILDVYKIPKEKVTVTYPGYDRKNFRIFKPALPAGGFSNFQVKKIKKKYGVTGDYILFLSTLKPNKNVKGLLKAFKLLDIKDLKLVVAGRKGWLFKEIFRQVKRLNLKDKVIFTGFVDEKDVPTLIKKAKVYVLPSFWEGFGISVVEAMACGTPVVVAKAGSLPEIVGKAGVMVDPYQPEAIAEGIKKALNQADELSKKGLKQAQKFSWHQCGQKTLAVLNAVKNN